MTDIDIVLSWKALWWLSHSCVEANGFQEWECFFFFHNCTVFVQSFLMIYFLHYPWHCFLRILLRKLTNSLKPYLHMLDMLWNILLQLMSSNATNLWRLNPISDLSWKTSTLFRWNGLPGFTFGTTHEFLSVVCKTWSYNNSNKPCGQACLAFLRLLMTSNPCLWCRY